jgi:hypothetical protein
MFPIMNQAQIENSSSKSLETTPISTLSKSREIKESQCILTSVKNLRQSIVKGRHKRTLISQLLWELYFVYGFLELTEILEKHIFVGIVDIHRCLSLIQCSTNLYLVNHDALAWVFFTFVKGGQVVEWWIFQRRTFLPTRIATIWRFQQDKAGASALVAKHDRNGSKCRRCYYKQPFK